MKHTLPITAILVFTFLLTQLAGIFIIKQSIQVSEGEVSFEELPYEIERPPLEEGTSFLFIIFAVIFGTVLVLLIIKFRKPVIWKIWYLLSVIFTIAISLSVFLDELLAFIIGFLVGLWKVYRPNVYVHNISEIFIYSGIALIFIPVMNIFSVSMLLIIISFYDMYAVWKSKHMVKLANFQTQTKVFAGLSIPYNLPKPVKKGIPVKRVKTNVAVLGGGDIAFPLIFTGVLLKYYGNLSLLVSLVTTIALGILLLKSEKGKFYPAMPFISAGCFLGLGLVALLSAYG